MKAKTAGQYAERFKRRGDRQKRRWAKDFIGGVQSPRTNSNKPNHILRVVGIEDVFAGHRHTKPKKGYAANNIGGIPLVGNYRSCPRTLVEWKVRPVVTGRGSRIETKYDPYAYPCVVDHGNKWAKGARGLKELVSTTGEKGEHRDSLGRTW